MRVVYRFRVAELGQNGLHFARDVWPADGFGEAPAIAEKQRLKLMHGNVRDEAASVEIFTHVVGDVLGDSVLYKRGPFR